MNDPARPRRRRWPWALAALALLLVGAELAARVFAPMTGTLALFRRSAEPRMCFEPAPGVSGPFDVPGLPYTPIHFDARGFRGAEARPSAALRVVVAGGGLSFGSAGPDAAALAPTLGRELRMRGYDAEALNLAVPSYRPSQTAARFERDALPLHPQVLLLEQADGDFDPRDCFVYDLPAWLPAGLIVHSALVRTGVFAVKESRKWHTGSDDRRTRGLREVLAADRGLVALARTHGVRVGVFVTSRDDSVTPAALADFARLGVPVFDARAVAPDDRRDPFYSSQYGNYSARGSAVVARHLADWMAAQGLITPAPAR